MQMQITDNGRSNRMLHIKCARKPHVNQDPHTECCTLINCAWEPHINQDLFISHTVSQRESSKST